MMKRKISKKTKYDLNYIIKHIDIKKFIKFLKNECLYEGDSESSIINYAIVSCAKTKESENDLINNRFFKTYPNKFLNVIGKYETDGTILNKINFAFKKIHHIELRNKGDKKKEIESHTFYQFRDSLNNLFFYITNTKQYDLKINQVVKFYKSNIESKMDIKWFIYEIINFKRNKQIAETEPTTSMLYEKPENLFNKFTNNKTGRNLLLEHNIPDNVYASFDDEELADFKKKKK